MRVAIEELASRITSTSSAELPKVICLNGNEPLLLEEALDGLRASLKQHGFAERIKYQLEAGFDWQNISDLGMNMSLFSERRLIELRVLKSLGVAGTKAVTEYCEQPSEEDILLLIMPYLDKRQRQAKWLKAIDQCGWVVDFYEISQQQFPAWLKQRVQSRSLRVQNGVIELLNEKLEGNVLAAAQEVDKLTVLADNGAVTLELVNRSLADQARFDVYELADNCLLGSLERVVRIKNRLQTEGVKPVIVVWELARELRTLVVLSSAINAGKNKNAVFKEQRIWSKREGLFNAALQRLSLSQCHSLLSQVAILDQSIKGQRRQEVGTLWHQIECLCVAICGIDMLEQNKRSA